jgi:hypothetical protein
MSLVRFAFALTDFTCTASLSFEGDEKKLIQCGVVCWGQMKEKKSKMIT